MRMKSIIKRQTVSDKRLPLLLCMTEGAIANQNVFNFAQQILCRKFFL